MGTNINSQVLYSTLSSLGNFEALKITYPADEIISYLNEQDWKVYNNSKPNYKRWGLSLFSLDGSDSGEIDLNSIREYNNSNNTNYNELSFNTPTVHWKNLKSISEPLKPIEQFIGRSHFIKLEEGGFFPPHRDLGDSFRLISFFNCCFESTQFVLNGQQIKFNTDRLYFADTRKNHSVVSFGPDTYVLVFNIAITTETLSFVLNNLEQI